MINLVSSLHDKKASANDSEQCGQISFFYFILKPLGHLEYHAYPINMTGKDSGSG
jgi:hypothetical protein